MKKTLCLWMILVLLAAMAGCQKEQIPAYETKIIDTHDGGQLFSQDLRTESVFQREEAPETLTVKSLISGEEITGSYDRSGYNPMFSYATDIYYCENGWTFEVKSGTKEVVNTSHMGKGFFNAPTNDEKTILNVEQATEGARELLGTYVEDPQAYEVENAYEIDNGTFLTYRVEFSRKINGLPSGDYVRIVLTDRGKTAHVCVGDVGAFSGRRFENNTAKQMDEKSVEASILEKAVEAYQGEGELGTCTLKNARVVLYQDGAYYVLATVEIQLPNGDTALIQTLTSLPN